MEGGLKTARSLSSLVLRVLNNFFVAFCKPSAFHVQHDVNRWHCNSFAIQICRAGITNLLFHFVRVKQIPGTRKAVGLNGQTGRNVLANAEEDGSSGRGAATDPVTSDRPTVTVPL